MNNEVEINIADMNNTFSNEENVLFSISNLVIVTRFRLCNDTP